MYLLFFQTDNGQNSRVPASGKARIYHSYEANVMPIINLSMTEVDIIPPVNDFVCPTFSKRNQMSDNFVEKSYNFALLKGNVYMKSNFSKSCENYVVRLAR